MNVEATLSAAVTTKPNETSSSSASSKTDGSTSFKDELKSVNTTDAQSEADNKASLDAENQNTQNNTNLAQKTAEETTAKQVAQNKLTQKTDDAKKVNEESEATNILDSFKELNSKIFAINELKNNSDSKTQSVDKKDEKTADISSYCRKMQMDNKDITFFVNLVDNQQMTAQTAQANNQTTLNNNNVFTEVKTEATQSTVKVSAALLDALNESVKTNKPFRIDFDNDIAVIMKVDKDGVLSANFIPGSSAVENYLRNNIEGLRQSFNDQNLPYRELSYSNQQKKEQQQQSQNKKENENE